ncbi:MAG: hypothetical protein HY481_02285 [Candidatus Vogelbacteria bacterium]|nr:hypothetical protein [Candidatus Vogelbacteria bacterium]
MTINAARFCRFLLVMLVVLGLGVLLALASGCGNQPLLIGRDVVVNGDLTVRGDTEVVGSLDVGGDVTADDVIVGDDLEVADDVEIGDNVTIDGNAAVVGDLGLGGEIVELPEPPPPPPPDNTPPPTQPSPPPAISATILDLTRSIQSDFVPAGLSVADQVRYDIRVMINNGNGETLTLHYLLYDNTVNNSSFTAPIGNGEVIITFSRNLTVATPSADDCFQVRKAGVAISPVSATCFPIVVASPP